MNHALYGHDTGHARIATSLYLRLVYANQGKLEEPLSMDRESLQVERTIYGHDSAHPDMAASLYNLALVYRPSNTHRMDSISRKKSCYAASLFMILIHRMLLLLYHLPI